MRNSKLIKLICLILCLFMTVSLLGACSNSGDNNSSSEPPVSSDDFSSEEPDDNHEPGSDMNSDEYDEPIDTGDGDQPEDEDEEQEGIKTLHIYNGEAPINTNYRGMSSTVYHAYGHMLDDKYGRVYTDEMIELELSRLVDSGIHYARTRYTTEWAWDGRNGGWNWDSNRMTYFWNYCRNLQERNIEVLQQVGWHLGCIAGRGGKEIKEHPYVMEAQNYEDVYGECADYDFSKCKDDNYRLYAKKSLRLAEAHAQLLIEAKSRGIHNITHLMYFTEPSSPNSNGNLEGDEGNSADEYIFVVKTIQQKLKDRGVYNWVKHVGPNQGSIHHGNGLLRYMLERDCLDLFDIWTAHFYPEARDASENTYFSLIDPVFESYLQPLKDVGGFKKVEFWVDEFYCRSTNAKLGVDSPWAGLQMAVGGIIAQQKGINNISIWQIFDQLWTDQINNGDEFVEGIHVCGSAPSLFVSSIPRGQYYSTGLFSRYNGYQNGKAYRTNNDVIQNEHTFNDVHVGAVQLEDGNWTITVVNASLVPYEITVEFDKAIYQTLYRHVNNVNTNIATTAAKIPEADKTFANVKDRFFDIIEAGTVVIYTGVKG